MSLDMNIKRKEQSKIQVMSPLRSFMSPGFHVLVLYVHKENKLKEVFKQLEKWKLLKNKTALNEQILFFFMPSASLQSRYQSWLLHVLIISAMLRLVQFWSSVYCIEFSSCVRQLYNTKQIHLPVSLKQATASKWTHQHIDDDQKFQLLITTQRASVIEQSCWSSIWTLWNLWTKHRWTRGGSC